MAPLKALVTGGTRGIGAATAVALRDAGLDVVVTGTTVDGPRPQGCGYLQAEFSDTQHAAAFAAQIADAEFSVLVNNAGINKIGPLADYTLADLERILQVNLVAPFLLCRAVVPGMRARRYGRIVNITSIWGVVSKAGRSAYSSSKFGLFGLTRALALEVAADNVIVNCVAPGVVETELTRQTLGEAGIADLVRQVPAGRMARPEEIARYVRFLAGEENTYMTGQTLVVDGGFTSR